LDGAATAGVAQGARRRTTPPDVGRSLRNEPRAVYTEIDKRGSRDGLVQIAERGVEVTERSMEGGPNHDAARPICLRRVSEEASPSRAICGFRNCKSIGAPSARAVESEKGRPLIARPAIANGTPKKGRRETLMKSRARRSLLLER